MLQETRGFVANESAGLSFGAQQSIQPTVQFPNLSSAPFPYLLILLALLAFVADAQDARAVTEPRLRPVCLVLKATLAEVQEESADMTRIQQALDQCPAGQSVELAAEGNANLFLSGPLQMHTGNGLRVDAGVKLLASRNPRDYDVQPGSCGILSDKGHGCRALINGNRALHVTVEGDGIIDGRGGETMIGSHESWWQLAEDARHGDKNQNCPRLMEFVHSDDLTLYRITLLNSPNFHVSYSQGNGFTVWGVKVFSPQRARNTDGIDPSSSSNVTIAYSYIHTGDDQVAIKAGDAGPSSHITLEHNHFYTGHGISIGSETNGGVSAVRVQDLTIDGADNGIRIKSNSSRGGIVEDIQYEDVCIRDTKNPIFMDSNYSFYGTARDKLPLFRNVTLRRVWIEGGVKITLEGFDTNHLLQMKLDNVIWQTLRQQVSARYADLELGPGPVNFIATGEQVHVHGKPDSHAEKAACAAKFVAMPL